jgi:hypothetical protein
VAAAASAVAFGASLAKEETARKRERVMVNRMERSIRNLLIYNGLYNGCLAYEKFPAPPDLIRVQVPVYGTGYTASSARQYQPLMAIGNTIPRSHRDHASVIAHRRSKDANGLQNFKKFERKPCYPS